MKKLSHVLSARQFVDRAVLDEIFDVTQSMERDDAFRTLPQTMRGRILATLFYEPSTRTRLSFESAMQKLGGGVLTVENARDSSSAAKGETIADTIQVVSGYADVIAIRHFEEGAAQEAARLSPVPVINAGDGVGEHPTQSLMDLYTIKKELGHLDGLRIVLVGDLLNGRTIHSLLTLFARCARISLALVSPPQLRLPEKYRQELLDHGVEFTETTVLDEVIRDADVVYITRVQRERFASDEEYARVKDAYIIDGAVVETLKREAILMHALPRTSEIAPEVDSNIRAAYFRQAKNGLYIRMALLHMLLA